MEEATKPQEHKNVTRRATGYKAQEEVQTGQVTTAPEAMAAVKAEEVATAKRRRRRSARSKVRVAARKGQKGEVKFSLLLINSYFCIPLFTVIRIVDIVRSLMMLVSECAADASDAVNGPTVSDDPKEEQVVEVIEEGPTKPNEGEMPHRSGCH